MEYSDIEKLIDTQQPYSGSVDDFILMAEKRPNKIYKLTNFLEFVSNNWNHLDGSQKKIICLIIEEQNLVEDFHLQLNLKEIEKFSFSETNGWSHENLTYFNIKINNETKKELEVVNMSLDLELRVSKSKVLCFEEVSPSFSIIKDSKVFKNIQLGLGAMVLGLSTMAMNKALDSSETPRSISSISRSMEFSDIVRAVSYELNNSKKSELLELKNKLDSLNLEEYSKIQNASALKSSLKSFYEEANPKHLDTIGGDIDTIVESVLASSEANDVDPLIILSILKVESDFNQRVVSNTGDFSLAQINYNIWSKELKRVKKIDLDFEKLKTDIPYSVDIMGKILKILEKRHKKDPDWYARYHSGTVKFKMAYSKKLNTAMESIKENSNKYMINELTAIKTTINNLPTDVIFEAAIKQSYLDEIEGKINDILMILELNSTDNEVVAFNDSI